MHLLLNRWTYQLQTLQMLWLDQKRVFGMVYHQLKSSVTCVQAGGACNFIQDNSCIVSYQLEIVVGAHWNTYNLSAISSQTFLIVVGQEMGGTVVHELALMVKGGFCEVWVVSVA